MVDTHYKLRVNLRFSLFEFAASWQLQPGFPSESACEHRHINIKDYEWNVAIIYSIWERGLEKDIGTVILEVKTNANAADVVRRAMPHSKGYGWPKFFKLYIEKIYGKQRG